MKKILYTIITVAVVFVSSCTSYGQESKKNADLDSFYTIYVKPLENVPETTAYAVIREISQLKIEEIDLENRKKLLKEEGFIGGTDAMVCVTKIIDRIVEEQRENADWFYELEELPKSYRKMIIDEIDNFVLECIKFRREFVSAGNKVLDALYPID